MPKLTVRGYTHIPFASTPTTQRASCPSDLPHLHKRCEQGGQQAAPATTVNRPPSSSAAVANRTPRQAMARPTCRRPLPPLLRRPPHFSGIAGHRQRDWRRARREKAAPYGGAVRVKGPAMRVGLPRRAAAPGLADGAELLAALIWHRRQQGGTTHTLSRFMNETYWGSVGIEANTRERRTSITHRHHRWWLLKKKEALVRHLRVCFAGGSWVARGQAREKIGEWTDAKRKGREAPATMFSVLFGGTPVVPASRGARFLRAGGATPRDARVERRCRARAAHLRFRSRRPRSCAMRTA